MGTDVRRIPVSSRTQGLDTLVDPDFEVSFDLAGAAPGRTGEEWARAIFEDPPAPVRAFLTVGWRYGLFLRLGSASDPTKVRGWPVVTSAPAVTILAADSPLIEAHNMVEVLGDGIVFTTRVRYRNPAGRALWAVAGRIHVWTLPRLLRRAAR
jgi:hypothetical protein